MNEKRYQYLKSLTLEEYDKETSIKEQKEYIKYQDKYHIKDKIIVQTFSR